MANGWSSDVDITEVISLLQGGGLGNYADLYDMYSEYQDLDTMGFGAWYEQGGHDLFQNVLPGLSDYQREMERLAYTTQSDVELARAEEAVKDTSSAYSYSGFEGSGSGVRPASKDSYGAIQESSDQARLLHRLEQRELGETMATDFWSSMGEFEDSMDIDELSGSYGDFMDYNWWMYSDWDDTEALMIEQSMYGGSDYGWTGGEMWPTYEMMDFNQSGDINMTDVVHLVNYKTEYGDEFDNIADMCAGVPELSDDPMCQSIAGSVNIATDWNLQAADWLLDAWANNPNSIQFQNVENAEELQTQLSHYDSAGLVDYLGSNPQAYLDLLGLDQSDFWGDWTPGVNFCDQMVELGFGDDQLANYGCL
jgi:hypothetical protein